MLRQTDIITASSIGRALILMNSNPNPITDITFIIIIFSHLFLKLLSPRQRSCERI